MRDPKLIKISLICYEILKWDELVSVLMDNKLIIITSVYWIILVWIIPVKHDKWVFVTLWIWILFFLILNTLNCFCLCLLWRHRVFQSSSPCPELPMGVSADDELCQRFGRSPQLVAVQSDQRPCQIICRERNEVRLKPVYSFVNFKGNIDLMEFHIVSTLSLFFWSLHWN